jgi:hypothetical protein
MKVARLERYAASNTRSSQKMRELDIEGIPEYSSHRSDRGRRLERNRSSLSDETATSTVNMMRVIHNPRVS